MSKTTQAMKSHKNEPRSNRWKWMAGATAATAAGVTASQANTITVNLGDNYISGAGGNHLNADLTGDGHPDLTIANAYYRFLPGRTYSHNKYFAGVLLNGVQAYAYWYRWPPAVRGRLGSRSAYFYFDEGTRSLMGSIPIFFKDLHINGGAPTEGFLEVMVSPGDIQLDSLTYNDPSFHGANRTAVPDQGSSLALLAMGAGGILALRRWRAAQGRS